MTEEGWDVAEEEGEAVERTEPQCASKVSFTFGAGTATRHPAERCRSCFHLLLSSREIQKKETLTS